MARSRTLEVKITGDASSLNRSLKGANSSLDKFGKQTSLHGRLSSGGFSRMAVAASGATAAVGGLAAGAGFLIKQYEESAKVGRQTQAVLKSTGGAANVTAKQVGDLATALSKKSGIDDEAIQSGENLLLTFTNIRNETGKGNRIFDRATRTLTDMSAALGQDTKSSAIQLGKALNDPVKGVTALQRVGVSFTQSQKDQIKTLTESGHKMDAQKLILRELNKEFGGSAKAANTPFKQLQVTVGNLAEKLGGFLAPAARRVASALNTFIGGMQDGTGAGGRFVQILKNVGAFVVRVKNTIVDWVHSNRREIAQVGEAFENIAAVVRKVFTGLILPTIRRMLPAFKQIFDGVIRVLHGFIEVFTGIFTGDFGKMWRGIKDIFAGGFKAAWGAMRAQTAAIRELASQIGHKIVGGIVSGLSGLGHAILDRLKDVAGWLGDKAGGLFKSIGNRITHPLGDGVGKAIHQMWPAPTAPGGAGLMGAQAALAPFAAIGQRFGLGVSSGRRPGSITSSGNLSYHSTGEAIDVAGPPGGMLGFFRYMKARFGNRLAELIYTPGGMGIKNGQLFRYGGQVARDHFDHVHVAVDTGRPGVGDGIGQAATAARAAGFRGRDLLTAIAIAGPESGYRNSARLVTSREDSRGMWQINTLAHPWARSLNLHDPNTNARAAYRVYREARGFAPWSGFTSGRYRAFLDDAQHIVSGGGGSAGSARSTMPHVVGVKKQPTTGRAMFPAGGPNVNFITPAIWDYIQGHMAIAANTPDTADDAMWNDIARKYVFAAAVAAQKRGDWQAVAQWQNEWRSLTDTGDSGGDIGTPDTSAADDEAERAREAQQALTDALTAVRDELKRTNDLSERYANTTDGVLARAVTDIVSGTLGGRIGLGFATAGVPGQVSRL